MIMLIKEFEIVHRPYEPSGELVIYIEEVTFANHLSPLLNLSKMGQNCLPPVNNLPVILQRALESHLVI